MQKKWLKILIKAVLALIITSLILAIWMPFLQAIRIISSFVIFLIIPGYTYSWLFWKKDQIPKIERIVISPILSLVIVPLVIFALNRVGVKINLVTISIEILCIIFIGIMIMLLTNKTNFRKV